MGSHVSLGDHFREQRLFNARIVAIALGVALCTIVVVIRLIVLQVVHHDHFRELSRGNRVRIEPVPPTRGLIFDRNGFLLAENLPAYQLELVPEAVGDPRVVLDSLVGLDLVRQSDLARINETITRRRVFDAVPLRYRLDETEVARFAVVRPHYAGVDIRARLARHYPAGPMAVHAIGYVSAIDEQDILRVDKALYAGTTHIGKVGVEQALEDQLHGAPGHQQILVNAQGRSLQSIARVAPQPGRDLFLTLDMRLQRAAEQALAGRRGAVVAIDPRDGGVLALVSAPAFDPNQFGEGLSRAAFAELANDPDNPLFNRALRGHYPPGSTVKPMLALAALHYGVRSPSQELYCPGHYMLPGDDHRYRDWKKTGHEHVNLISAIEQSCDVYFYDLALELGIDRMHEFMTRFGFGVATGIDIHGEKRGLMPSRAWKRTAFSVRAEQVWFPGETLITGIGQGFMLATPLQLAHATATLAARGKRFRPQLIRATRDPVTGTVIERPAEPLPGVEVTNDTHWDVVIAAMHDVVHGERGTARAIGMNLGYRMAGKTGTAQVFTIAQEEEYDEEEVAERLRHHALFVAFAPVAEPEVALAVVVENAGSGSGAAAPVARDVLEAWFAPGDTPLFTETAAPGTPR